MDVNKLIAVVKSYRATEARNREYVQDLARQAEETGDYYDYDQASYDFYECMTELGQGVIRDIEELLERVGE